MEGSISDLDELVSRDLAVVPSRSWRDGAHDQTSAEPESGWLRSRPVDGLRGSRLTARQGLGFGIGLALLGVIALHLFAPALSITWSYAHLSRDPWRVVLALVLTLALPPLTTVWWASPSAGRPLERPSPRQVLGFAVCLVLGMGLLGRLAPATGSNYDSVVLLEALHGKGEAPIRWMLGFFTLDALTPLLRTGPSLVRPVASLNSALAGVGVLGLIVAARSLAHTRGEAWAIAALTLSAFGTLQIAVGYIEIYPLALGFVGLYVGMAARVLRHDASPLWCAVLVSLAPFFYIGLGLLAPSAIVLAVCVARRPAGAKQLVVAGGAALLAAGLATLPEYGQAFAWSRFATEAAAASHPELGLQAGSSLLPADYLVSAAHAIEVLHSLLLVDAVGWILLLGTGLAVLVSHGIRAPDRFAIFLAAIALPYVGYAFVMDPIYGPYQDWDLWATGAPVVSLLGAWAFVGWGRASPKLTGALLGIALACAGVHALARMHAMPLEKELHLRESPMHLPARAGAGA